MEERSLLNYAYKSRADEVVVVDRDGTSYVISADRKRL